MNESQADVEATVHDGGPLIRIRGEVDLSNADTVRDEIRAVADPADAVMLDLEAVEFFDSSALRMLQRLSAAFDTAGGKLTVVADPAGIVGRLFTITGMDAYLNISGPLPQ